MGTHARSLMSLSVAVGADTDIGRTRTENQDRMTRAPTPFGDLYVVADGMGGYLGGAEAARFVVDGFASHLQAASPSDRLEEVLQRTAGVIGTELLRRGEAESKAGMGSTVVLCLVHGTTATIAHAGDSRAYLLRNRGLTRLTRDHSVGEQLGAGRVLQSGDSSVLTRALGQRGGVARLDISDVPLQPGDAILLCTDGLWSYVRDEEMSAVVSAENLSPQAAATALINLALDGGGGDNVSVQFLRFDAPPPPPAARRKKIVGVPLGKALAGTSVVAVLTASTIAMLAWNRAHPLDNPAARSLANGSTAGAALALPADTTIDIVLVQNGARFAAWAPAVEELPYVNASRRPMTSACAALAQRTDILLYTPEHRSTALRIGSELGLPLQAMVERPRRELAACGAEAVAVLPRRSAQAQTMTERLRRTLGQYADF